MLYNWRVRMMSTLKLNAKYFLTKLDFSDIVMLHPEEIDEFVISHDLMHGNEHLQNKIIRTI